jgi:hemoglobin
MNNPAINARFLPLKEQTRTFSINTKHILSFLVLKWRPRNTPKDMVTKQIMNISRGEFTHVIDDILGVLEKKTN